MKNLRLTIAMCAFALTGNAAADFIQSPIPPSLYNNYFRDTDGDGKMDRIELYFLGNLTAENLAQTLDSLSYTWVDEDGAIERNVIPRSALAFDTTSARRLFYDLPQTISIHKDLTEFDLSSYGSYGAVELYHTDAGSAPDSVNVQMKDGMPPAIREVFLSMAQNGSTAEDTLTVSFTESVMEEQTGSALFECKDVGSPDTQELSANILRWSDDGRTVILTGKNLAADSIRIREAALKDSAGNRTQENSAFHVVNATYPISIYTNTKAEMRTSDSLRKLPIFQWIFASQGEASPMGDELGVAISAGGPEAATAIRDALRRNRPQQTNGLDFEEIPVDPSKLSFSMELRIFTNSGDYVTGTLGEVKCTDSRFSASGNGTGNCITSPKRLLLRWNFMASDRRLVGTGAYIAQFPVATYDGITLYRSDKGGRFLQTWACSAVNPMEPFETEIYNHYFQVAKFRPMECETRHASLDELLERYDAFFFDAFGTLYNRRHYVYPGAWEMFHKIRKRGKSLRLVTNAASQTMPRLMNDLDAMDLHFDRSEIFSSGGLFAQKSPGLRIKECFYIGHDSGREYLAQSGMTISEDPAGNAVAISAVPDSDAAFERALAILKRPQARLFVLNPDAWAPRDKPPRDPVSGAFAHRLFIATHCKVSYYGKPFPEIFENAKRSLPDGTRIVMIGDTLATDIAGAINVGIDAALIPGRNMAPEKIPEDERILRVRPTYYLDV